MKLSSSARRALHAVLISGSYAAAARHAGVSQPAIAQQVKSLERHCGAALFERRDGYLAPTSFCEELIGLTEKIDALEEQAARLLERRHSIHTGQLRVGLGNSMPGMALIAAFQREYPQVNLSVTLSDFAHIIQGVVEGQLDIGVLPNVPPDERFVRETLIHQEVVAIAHPDDPISRFSRIDCEQLMQVPLIFRSRGSSTQALVDTAFRKAGLKPRARLVLDTRDGVYEAVANRLGVGFMWRHGTGRTDAIHRIAVTGMGPPCPESVFRLVESQDPVIRAFFVAAKNFRRHAEVLRSR
ncbi:LysR family transcriptional regulator [Billgrantia montanilacus]|uniref:LysR family transcriptional regulator n=1 Tax=Billgrantia montanilacus TaxID=2282305 RepID=A0A368TTR4_9GAMM|nr:LysR family transcriptional regulator [Halomonas montanilacus]RCV87991.1 LysR family transcriptional regulator [Halomonas montanilacus]